MPSQRRRPGRGLHAGSRGGVEHGRRVGGPDRHHRPAAAGPPDRSSDADGATDGESDGASDSQDHQQLHRSVQLWVPSSKSSTLLCKALQKQFLKDSKIVVQ